MRKDWEYKTLGEICDIYQPKTISNEMLVKGGKYPVYGANGTIGFYNSYNHIESEILLTCRGATCGTINVSQPYSWINGNAMVIHRKSDYLDFKFLYFLMKSLDYSLVINGAAQPQITRARLAPIKVAIPPKSTQLSIVSELDNLNELIRIKKEQLKDYDTLAQSIFYEMFGDPVENEKGWEVKKLMEICDVRDGTHDSPKYVESSNYMLITSKNIVNRAISFDDVNYITEEDYNNINKRSKVDDGDIIMPMIGTIGNPVIVYLDNIHKFSIKNVALIKFFHNTSILNRYLLELMISDSFRKYLLSLNKGGTQKFVALGTIRRMDIILPPLPLQQSFAHKIEQIERQKAAVQSTITDLETLLAVRMQYWFD